MKTTILLAALAALTCPIWAQSTPGPNMPAIHERPFPQDKTGPGPDMVMTNSMATVPALTPEQRLALRDAQVPWQTAVRELQVFMLTNPEYVRLKAATESTFAKFQQVASEAVKKTCADCQLDVETLNLTRPQQAKVEKPAEKK